MNQTTGKKCILYVGNQYWKINYIHKALEKKYSITTYSNLEAEVIDFIRRFHDRTFAAVITNMPPNAVRHYLPPALKSIFYQNYYQNSLDILKEIKKLMDIPILIYTSADDSPAVDIVFSRVGDDIVRKSGDVKKDFRRINVTLDRLLEKYEKMPLQSAEPVIEIRNGYSVAKVRLNLNNGLNIISFATISQECHKYGKVILFKKAGGAGNSPQIYNPQKILDFFSSWDIREGDAVSICVEGVGEEAERMARRLYAALGSRYWFTMDLNRFERIEEDSKSR